MSLPAAIEPEAIEAVYLTMRAHVVRAPGEGIEWGELCGRMVSDWTAHCPWTEEPCITKPAPSAAAFAVALAHVCRRTGLQAKAIGTKGYCIDLALRPLTLPTCAECPHQPADGAPEAEPEAPAELWAPSQAPALGTCDRTGNADMATAPSRRCMGRRGQCR
jgi:hypothetical protein